MFHLKLFFTLLIFQTTGGFVPTIKSPNSSNIICGAKDASDEVDSNTQSKIHDGDGICLSRRNFGTSSMASLIAAFIFTRSPAAHAKEEDAEVVTPEMLTEAFRAVSTEASSPTGGIASLAEALNDGNWPFVLEFTKDYDLSFRKLIMGKARKMIPKTTETNAKLREQGLLLTNGVTFDLIGVNRAARTKDADAAKKAYNLLIEDIQKFLDLGSQVEF
uniref:Uncharacterized protein n=1 Tax=Corethron hystrix TaxID=216773 RepID=A0A7S1BQ70_9STRA|mmetsp:Transcript_34376/g.79480  ORF Transcript_34376/g.79480 Transcript_34376/m.79480 type:complete len:218 (+) Transcript_34376:210-863(+)